MSEKRRDSNNVILRTGEGQRANGTYFYRWTGKNRKQNYIYAKTLKELREKEKEIIRDQQDGIKFEARNVTLNQLTDLWFELKRGLKNNTRENYSYVYNMFVRPQFGCQRIIDVKKSDVKRFYNYLVDDRGLQARSVEQIHTVLGQVFEMAVDDNYIRSNPTTNVMRELKRTHVPRSEQKRALTKAEQQLLLDFLKNDKVYGHWYPIFAVMLGTGLRVGEVTGLRWCDVNLENGMIDVNHTLVYYCHRRPDSKQGCYFNVQTPKTVSGIRQVPMLDFVKEAFLMEKENQKKVGLTCNVVIDGYTDFVFLNRFGKVQHQGILNKAIQRITRDCNDAEFLKNENPKVLLPVFSCHTLRHTFATRLCETGMNVKVIQDTLGHKDISTTLNIYTEVTKDFKKEVFAGVEKYFGSGEAV